MDALFLSTSEVARHSGATYRQVDYWCRRGWVPGQRGGPGSGHARLWTYAQLAAVRRLARAAHVARGGLLGIAEAMDRGELATAV